MISFMEKKISNIDKDSPDKLIEEVNYVLPRALQVLFSYDITLLYILRSKGFPISPAVLQTSSNLYITCYLASNNLSLVFYVINLLYFLYSIL